MFSLKKYTFREDRINVLQTAYPFLDVCWFYAIYNKIYKAKIIHNNNLRFDNSLKMGEDFCFNLDYISFCNSIDFIDKCLYKYYVGENFLSNRFDNDYLEKRKKVLERVNLFYEKNKLIGAGILEYQYVKTMFSAYMKLFNPNCKLTIKEKKNVIADTFDKKISTRKIKMEYKKILCIMWNTHNVNLIYAMSKLLYFVYKKIRKRG